jgi:CBS domain containing-hemolysin-like protein
MDIKNVMIQVPKIPVNSAAKDALSSMGPGANKAIILNPGTGQILGIAEKWRLQKAQPEKTLDEQLAEKPYLSARVPAVPASYQVSQIEQHFPRSPAVIATDENGEPVGIVSLREIYRARRADIDKL